MRFDMQLRMSKLLAPTDIERIADAAGTTIAKICRDARVARSTFTRWKAGQTVPRLTGYQRLSEAAQSHAAGKVQA